jgi:hypothetical protein
LSEKKEDDDDDDAKERRGRRTDFPPHMHMRPSSYLLCIILLSFVKEGHLSASSTMDAFYLLDNSCIYKYSTY